MLEVGNGLFQLVVNGQRASQSPHTVCACAEFIHCFFCGFVNARMTDQSQITVGGIHAHLASVNHSLCAAAHFLHRLVVKIEIICLKLRNAVIHRLNAAGDCVIGSVKIHELPPKLECCKFSLGVWFCLVGYRLQVTSYVGQPSASFFNSASSKIFTPSDFAFSAFEPGASPSTR